MKLGIISDTHGYLDPQVEEIFAGVDHILHAGDIGNPILELELKFIAPVTMVLGNTDHGLYFKETEVATLAERKFLVHHIVNPRALTDALQSSIRLSRADAVIFGHTHKRFAETIDGDVARLIEIGDRPLSPEDEQREQARLDALNKLAGSNTTQAEVPVGGPNAEVEPGANGATPGQGSAGLTADQKKEFIEVTKRLKLLTDRRAQILARVGDDYVMAPPKLATKP